MNPVLMKGISAAIGVDFEEVQKLVIGKLTEVANYSRSIDAELKTISDQLQMIGADVSIIRAAVTNSPPEVDFSIMKETEYDDGQRRD